MDARWAPADLPVEPRWTEQLVHCRVRWIWPGRAIDDQRERSLSELGHAGRHSGPHLRAAAEERVRHPPVSRNRRAWWIRERAHRCWFNRDDARLQSIGGVRGQ